MKRICKNCRNFWANNPRPCGCEDIDDTCPAFSYDEDAEMFNRTKEWRAFAALVEKHVDEYTVPQYGDAPDDQIEAWECAAVVLSIGKRASRHGKNSREKQDALDLLKIAHEACVAYFKLIGERPYEEVSDED